MAAELHLDRTGVPTDDAPDIVSSTDEYAARFAGSVGRFFLNVQASFVLELLEHCRGDRILDVGGGHGQLVVPLTRAGHRVTVLGSRSSCARQLFRCSDVNHEFRTGSLLDLPFADRSFDVVIGIRLMAHVRDWRRLLAEFCRVSRQSVIVDYPERCSINRACRGLYGLKRAIEGDTRPYRCFSTQEVAESLDAIGYELVAVRKQFLLPMVLHRSLGNAAFSRMAERIARRLGATGRWGSPAIALAQTSSSADGQPIEPSRGDCR